MIYNEKEFSSHGLSIQVKGNLSAYHSIWHYGEPIKDLGGTARTLDEANGAIPLEKGVVSWFGYSVIDDSRSHALASGMVSKFWKKMVFPLSFRGEL